MGNLIRRQESLDHQRHTRGSFGGASGAQQLPSTVRPGKLLDGV